MRGANGNRTEKATGEETNERGVVDVCTFSVTGAIEMLKGPGNNTYTGCTRS